MSYSLPLEYYRVVERRYDFTAKTSSASMEILKEKLNEVSEKKITITAQDIIDNFINN